MADLRQKRHLFFDLDDTLWDFEGNSGRVLEELFSEFGLQQKLGAGFDVFYAAYKATNRQLWTRYYQKEIDKAYLRNHRFNLAFNVFDYDNYPENLLITEQYLARAPKGRLLKEGCVEALEYLKQNFKLHIITNGFKEAQAVKLDNCGLRNYFSVVMVSEEHGFIKPDEKIFRLAESLTGATPTECVMIGDNFECDVLGPISAGWEAVYFSDQRPAGFNGYFISRLAELKALF